MAIFERVTPPSESETQIFTSWHGHLCFVVTRFAEADMEDELVVWDYSVSPTAKILEQRVRKPARREAERFGSERFGGDNTKTT